MGVPKLWAELQPHGHDVALARLAEAVNERVNRTNGSTSRARQIRLGIDIAGWLFHAQKSQGGKAPILRSLFYRMCRLLNLPHILPVFVFDGPARPSMKRGNYVRATTGSDGDNLYVEGAGRRLIPDVKQLIEAFGFVWLDAPGEAEAELADLNHRGFLDAIMTDDVDAFVLGARLVVRFWGQDLSSIKARSDFLLGQGDAARDETTEAMSGTSDASSDSEGTGSQALRRDHAAMTDAQRKALHDNSVTYYDARSIQQASDLDRGGFVLVAILSGGDYDVKGLARCGPKIATGLAKAGFGKELYEGARKYLKAPTRSDDSATKGARPPSPEPQNGWNDFLQDWRDRLCQELASNKTGHLGRKLKKLSESEEVRELLSTPAALAVLATYIWPIVSSRQATIEAGTLDLARLACLIQDRFGWGKAWTMESMRSKVWTGCAMRLMLCQKVKGVSLSDLRQGDSTPSNSQSSLPRSPSKAVGRKAANNAKISTFFTSTRTQLGESSSSSDSDGASQRVPAFISSADILGERRHATTGFQPELRISIAVLTLAEVAGRALKDDDEIETRSEAASSQASPRRTPSKSSPSKTKTLHFTDASLPVRFWASKEVVLIASGGDVAYANYVKLRDAKAKKKEMTSPSKSSAAKKSQGQSNGGLHSFFAASRPASKARSGPSAEVGLLSAVAAATDNDTGPKKSPSKHMSPSKRKPGNTGKKATTTPRDTLAEDIETESSSSSPSPPPSPSLARRRAKRVSAHRDGLAERQLLERQTLAYDEARLQSLTSSEARHAPNFGDDSVELVGVSTRGKYRAKSNAADVIGSVTISDDSDVDV